MAQIGNININNLTKMITYIGKLLILSGIRIMGMKSEMEFIKEVN